jgi:YVTN family beta-propeller protein
MFILTLAFLLTAACGDQSSAKDEKAGTQSAGRVTKTLRQIPLSLAEAYPDLLPQMAIGAGSLWLANSGDGTITRVDLAEGKVVAEVTVSENFRWEPNTSNPRSVAASGERVWFPDRTGRAVSRIDPSTNRVVERIPVPVDTFVFAIAIDGDDLWLTSPGDGLVLRVDAKNKRVVSTIDDLFVPTAIALGAGSVWVVDHEADKVARIDPQTNKVVEQIPIGYTPATIAYGEGAIWTADLGSQAVSRVDPETNKEVARIDTAMQTFGVAVGGGSVWATGWRVSGCESGKGGALVRIDPETNKVAGRTRVDCALSVAATDDAVWVQGEFREEGKPEGTLVRVEPTAR